MPSELATALTALVERLAQLAAHDQGLRDDLNALALRLVSATESRENPGVTSESEKQPAGTALVVDGAPRDGDKASESLPILTLGSARPVTTDGLAERVRHRTWPTTHEDLGEIEARSRLKAEAMRWASTRRQLILNGADFRDQIAPKDRDLLNRANKLSECHLWMCKPSLKPPEDLTLLEDGARCFDLLADPLRTVRKVLGDPKLEKEFLELSMEVLAQSQSALRVALGRVIDRADGDQASVYEWLKSTANRKQIYLKRYMRLDDPADPSNLDEVRAFLDSTRDRLDGRRQTNERKRACLSKLSYHAKLIGKRGGNETDWNSIIEAVEEALRQGVPPSNVEIRDSLLPIIDQSPEGNDLSQGFSLVLREIRRFLDADEEARDQSPTPADNEQIELAASLLAEQTVMLVGGEPRSFTQDTIKSALRLKELIWIGANEIRSITDLEPYVARPEVAVVLVAIRWCRHSFGEVSRYCERHGKPLVRLPGGCNPRQVAAQILSQCGDRLARTKAADSSHE